MIIILTIKTTVPTIVQKDDLPVTHLQSVKHNIGHKCKIPNPCINHNKPRSVKIILIIIIMSLFLFIIN
jgi:hypothetical protein